MKVCIPVLSPQGVQSTISRHFGTAPHFVMLDTDRQEPLSTLSPNAAGSCQCGSPMLASMDVDAVICGGIGAGALERLAERGITVYGTEAATVSTALELLRQGRLAVLRDGTCRAGDGHGAHNCHAH